MNRVSSRAGRAGSMFVLVLGLASCSTGVPNSATTITAAAPPATMQAIVQNGNGGPEVLALETLPKPVPAAGQVLIKVYAAGVNPIDWKMRQGMGRRPDGPPAGGPAPSGPGAGGGPGGPPPGMDAGNARRIPGFDVAGVIDSVGPGVTQFKPGDKVLSMIGRSVPGLNGGYAEYTLAAADHVSAKPDNLSFAEAAGIGTAARAAMNMIDKVAIKPGSRVLVNGAAGGVGSLAAQIAKARGAYVIGTASPRHAQFLASIGVDRVIDYTAGPIESSVSDADIVMDTVGGESALHALRTLRKGGTYTTIAGRVAPADCTAAGVDCPAEGPPGPAAAASEGAQVDAVVQLAAAGKLRIHVDKTFPLAAAGAAQEASRAGHTEGKIILTVVADQADRK